uniref:non-specific serine/threonine protein kinase n=1 Tax=Plectus sambesii TaxID=2011161 RepID=A0A914V2T2_9BILA
MDEGVGQGSSERQVDLASFVPINSIDAAIHITSLDSWSENEQLGQGGNGEVYKYTTRNSKTPIAAGKHVKVQLWNLSKKQKNDLQTRIVTFVTELNMLHKISSECKERLVQFIGCHVGSKKLILFTEFMPNGSVKDHIIYNPLSESTALKYTFQAAQGLKFLHHYPGGRVFHRNIKCHNLLLTSEYDVKLADFGLAFCLSNDPIANNDSGFGSQSEPSSSAGAVTYTAPEVLAGATYGRSADIWSLGCALVEMLTCHPPHPDFWERHKERAQFLFIEQAQEGSTNPLQYSGHQLVPNASAPVQILLDCLFTKNKARRPRSNDVLEVFVYDDSASNYKIDDRRVEKLLSDIKEKEKMADVRDASKEKFFSSLEKVMKGLSSTFTDFELLRTTDEFLRSVFDFCCQGGPLNLNDTEKIRAGSQLSNILPIIESGLYEAFLPLNADRRQTAKIYRSAIQFLVDDFGNLKVDNPTMADSEAKRSQMVLSDRLAELLECGPVESLDENLVCWENDGALGEFLCNPPPIDLIGVPSSHEWWNEDERNSTS